MRMQKNRNLFFSPRSRIRLNRTNLQIQNILLICTFCNMANMLFQGFFFYSYTRLKCFPLPCICHNLYEHNKQCTCNKTNSSTPNKRIKTFQSFFDIFVFFFFYNSISFLFVKKNSFKQFSYERHITNINKIRNNISYQTFKIHLVSGNIRHTKCYRISTNNSQKSKFDRFLLQLFLFLSPPMYKKKKCSKQDRVYCQLFEIIEFIVISFVFVFIAE